MASPKPYKVVARIQEYDDTTFGPVEMDDFIEDWRWLKALAPDHVNMRVLHKTHKAWMMEQLDKIEEMARQCKERGGSLYFETD